MDGQGRVQDPRQDHPQDALQGTFNGEVGVGLLELFLHHDVGKQSAGGGGEDAADGVAQDTHGEQDQDVGLVAAEEEHEHRGEDDDAALHVVAEEHDLRLAEPVPQHAAHGRGEEQHPAAEGQIQALKEGVVVGDLQDVEADGEAVEDGPQLRHQGAEEHQPVVAVEKYVAGIVIHGP